VLTAICKTGGQWRYPTWQPRDLVPIWHSHNRLKKWY